MPKMRVALQAGLLVADGVAASGILQLPRLGDPPEPEVERRADATRDRDGVPLRHARRLA